MCSWEKGNFYGWYKFLLLGMLWIGGVWANVPAQAQTSPLTPIPSPTAASNGQITYLVTSGDTLVAIANRFQLNLELLYIYNGLNENSLLTIGQPLILGFTNSYTGTTFLEAYPHARVRPNGLITHIIQSGETLISIAVNYNIPLEQLYELNQLNENSLLQLNQELLIGITPQPQEIGGSSFDPDLFSTPTLTSTTPSPTAAQPTSILIIPPPPLATNTPLPPTTTATLTSTPTPIPSANNPISNFNFPLLLLGTGAILLLVAGTFLFYIARHPLQPPSN